MLESQPMKSWKMPYLFGPLARAKQHSKVLYFHVHMMDKLTIGAALFHLKNT